MGREAIAYELPGGGCRLLASRLVFFRACKVCKMQATGAGECLHSIV